MLPASSLCIEKRVIIMRINSGRSAVYAQLSSFASRVKSRLLTRKRRDTGSERERERGRGRQIRFARFRAVEFRVVKDLRRLMDRSAGRYRASVG